MILRQLGLSQKGVAEEVHRYRSDVVRSWNRFLINGNVGDRTRTGRSHSVFPMEKNMKKEL